MEAELEGTAAKVVKAPGATNSDPKTTTVGTCVVCEREIAVHGPRGEKLVHHGYRRPGHGYIVGDCFAVNLPPHELSVMAADEYRDARHADWTASFAYLERLKSGKVTELSALETVPVPTTAYRPNWWSTRAKDPGWTDALVKYGPADPKFAGLLKAAITDAEGRIRWCADEMARMSRAILTWKVLPLRTREVPVPDPMKRRRRRIRW